MKKLFISFALLGASLLAEAQTPQKAYTAFEDTVFMLHEAEVIAKKLPLKVTKLQVPLMDLPLTASRVNIAPLKIRGIYDLQEATRFAPSVNTRTTYGAFQQVSVRGFDYAPIEVDGMRDERTTFNSYPFPDLSFVEGIEVVKGPASVLAGHSAVGGVINVVRKRASSKKNVEAYLMRGSYGRHQASIGFGGKLIGRTNYFISVNQSGGEGWRSRNDKRFSTYAALSGVVGEKGIFDVRFAHNDDFYGTEIGLPPTMSNDVFKADGTAFLKKGDMLPNLPRDGRYNSHSDFMYNKGNNLSASYKHFFSEDWQLTEHVMGSIDDINYFGTEELSYRESKDPIYPYYYMDGDKKKYIDLDKVQLTFPLRFSHIAKTIQNHLELSGKADLFGMKHNILLGHAYMYMDRVSYSGYNLGEDVYGPGLFSLVDVYNPQSMGYMQTRFSKAHPSVTQTHGLYFQDLLELNRSFKVLLAGRYDYYDLKSWLSVPTIDGKRAYESRGDGLRNAKYHALSYRIGAVWEIRPSLTAYASLANFFLPNRSFYNNKTIFVNSQGKVFVPEDLNGTVFKPTTGYQAEVGMKYIISSKIQAGLSLYYIQMNNVIKTLGRMQGEVDGKPTNMTIRGQVGRIVSKGFEAELRYHPIQDLFFTVGYGLTDARYAQLKKNDLDKTEALEGDPVNYIPRNSFFSYGDYKFSRGIMKGLGLNYSLTFTDRIYRSYSQKLSYDPYWLLNIGASYQLPMNITLGFIVNNVLNQEYVAQSLGAQLVPSEPTNFRIMLRYKL